MPDHSLAVGPVLQLDSQIRGRLAFDLFPIPDIAFAFKDLRQAALHLRSWHIDARPLDADRVADAGQHIGDRVSHHVVLVPLPARLPHTRNPAVVGQLSETDPADAELAIDGPGPPAQHAPPLEAGREL